MKDKIKLFGLIALVAVIGFTMTACPPEGGDGGINDPKTLVVTMAKTIADYSLDGLMVGVFPNGTTKEQAIVQTGIVAYAGLEDQTDTDPVVAC